MPNRKWTKGELVFLRDLYDKKLTWESIADRLGRTALACKQKAGQLKITRSRLFTDEEFETIKALYADHTAEDIAKRLGRSKGSIYGIAQKLGLKTDMEFIRECGRESSQHPKAIANRFSKGHVPVNKGIKMPESWSPGRMSETQFKKGQKPHTWKPGIGHERISRDGYIEIKVNDSHHHGNFRLKHRVVWEKHNGPVPKGHCIAFRDTNRQNCDIENLELITRAELVRRNHHSNLPPEVKELIYTLAGFRRRLNDYAKKQD